MINGALKDNWIESEIEDGEFVRMESQFRNWVTVDGKPGISGTGGFSAEPGRYHLYVSYACPWAHRTLIFRKLKKLEDIVSVSVVHPHMLEKGWVFDDYPGATGDPLNGFDYLYEAYKQSDRNYTGIVSVPVLWDKKSKIIVNNESSEIIRMLNTAFNEYTDIKTDYYPESLRAEIDRVNSEVYENVNNGVYRCGFAATQKAYEHAFDRLFSTLDKMEDRLSAQRYLAGAQITEADWRLFTSLVRFDPVYYGHFKCNLRRIIDYPNLSNYLRDLYQQPGIADTVNMLHIKQHYYYSHEHINPSRIVPKGPELDFTRPHNRGRFS
jgi:putative glutathione S-transferase